MSYRIIANQRERAKEWAIPRLGRHHGNWDGASALILEKDNDIAACVLYNHFYPKHSVEISVAAGEGRWLTRPFLSAVFRAPFIEWDMRRVGASISADNVKSIKFCEHLGFKREGRIREGSGAGRDLLLYGMLKSECRYLGDDLVKGFSTDRARSDCDRSGSNAIECGDSHR